MALAVSDAHAGPRRAVREVFPGSCRQRCVAHLMRDVAGRLRGRDDRRRALAALSAVFRERDPALVRAAYGRAVEEIGRLEPRAAELLEDAREDALAYLAFPAEHRLGIRTNNVQERANREIKRRTDAVQVFPSSRSLVRLVGAALADRNDEWAAGHFKDASGMRDLGRDAESPAPTEETLRRAEAIVLEAMRADAQALQSGRFGRGPTPTFGTQPGPKSPEQRRETAEAVVRQFDLDVWAKKEVDILERVAGASFILPGSSG